MRHCEPVNPIHREWHGCHEERCGVSEVVKAAQSHDEIYAGDKLANIGHPETPHAHGTIEFGAVFGMTKENLPAPDEVACTETKKPIATGQNGELASVRDCGIIVSNLIHQHNPRRRGSATLGRKAGSFLFLETLRAAHGCSYQAVANTNASAKCSAGCSVAVVKTGAVVWLMQSRSGVTSAIS